MEKITNRHLLSETSGIPNRVPLRWVHLFEDHPRFDEHTGLQEILRDIPELEFVPGTTSA